MQTPGGGSPMVGRSRELDRIGGALARVRTGEGGVVVIGGEAGIGKSRLVAETLRLAEDLGLLTAQGHCYEQDRLTPYAPLIELLWQGLDGPLAGQILE